MGIACYLYAWQKYDEARAEFEKMASTPGLGPLAQKNAISAALGKLAAALREANKAGTTITVAQFRAGTVYRSEIQWEQEPFRSSVSPERARQNVAEATQRASELEWETQCLRLLIADKKHM